jgi:hypothetical protein
MRINEITLLSTSIIEKEQIINIIINALIALGTISVAILAIWGDWVKQKLAGPKLIIEVLDSSTGTFAIHKHNNKKAKYLYLKIANKRISSIAVKTRVLINRIEICNTGGTYKEHSISGPLPLYWQFSCVDPTYFPLLPSIGPKQTCDIGYIEEGSNFVITTPITLPEYKFEVIANGKLRMELIAIAENAKSKPIYIEIAWDGKWIDDPKEMGKHLTLIKVNQF